MIVMRFPLRLLAPFALAATIFAACAEGSTGIGGDDDEGEGGAGSGARGGAGGVPPGEGGAGAAGPTSVSSASSGPSSSVSSSGSPASSSSSSIASSSSSGGGGCDNTGNCDLCQDCALNTPAECGTLYDICVANPECLPLNDCFALCAPNDTICIDDCIAQYPNGYSDLSAAAECVFCGACYIDCDGASLGCI